jgi:hypothetical protein
MVSIAVTRDADSTDCTHLSHWVHDGHLHSLDVSWLDAPPVEFPPPAMGNPPGAERGVNERARIT